MDSLRECQNNILSRVVPSAADLIVYYSRLIRERLEYCFRKLFRRTLIPSLIVGTNCFLWSTYTLTWCIIVANTVNPT